MQEECIETWHIRVLHLLGYYAKLVDPPSPSRFMQPKFMGRIQLKNVVTSGPD